MIKKHEISSKTILAIFAYLILAIVSYGVYKNKKDEINMSDYKYPIDTPLITVTDYNATMFTGPGSNKKALGYLKKGIYRDSVKAVIMENMKVRNGYVFIKFKYKHWFYTYNKKTLNEEGAWIEKYWLEKSKEITLTEYLKHLKYNYYIY